MFNAEKKPNRQVQRTCSWITEATILLIDEKPYEKITVSDIVEKAGIARQTFYRNYKDKDEVVIQYFLKIFMSEFLIFENLNDNEKHDIVLTFNIKYMIKNNSNLLKILSIISIENLFADKINEWLSSMIKQEKVKLKKEQQLVYRYKIYYQIIGILIVIMDWFKNGMPLSIDNLLNFINIITVDTKIHYREIPNIQIRIIDE